MRKLTIKRKKTFVACAGKIRICMKVEEPSDIKLPDANLKVLGELKNGMTLNTEIPEQDTVLYVVFSKVLPQRYHSKFIVKAGENNEVLYTMPILNPFNGNPFLISRNEKVTSEDRLVLNSQLAGNQQSKSSKLLFFVFIIIFALIGAYVGWNIM